MMRLSLGLLVATCLLGFVSPAEPAAPTVGEVIDDYVSRWKRFSPSQARSEGFVDVNEEFEDLSPAAIATWIDYNQATLKKLEALSDVTRDERIDGRLLGTQIRTEIDRWQNDKPHENSLPLYAGLISNGLSPIVESTLLSGDEKRRYLLLRLEQVEKLARTAKSNLRNGRRPETSEALADLESSASYIETDLPRAVSSWFDEDSASILRESSARTAQAISELIGHARGLLPSFTLPDEPILGRETFARKLEIYTDSDLTPEQLGEIALWEIETTKKALLVMATAYWRTVDPETPLPDDFDTLVGRAFADLEANRPTSEQEYLLELRKYGREVEEFVRDNKIASVPEHQTLSIELAPEPEASA